MKPSSPPKRRARQFLEIGIAMAIIALLLVLSFQTSQTIVHVNLWNGLVHVPPGGVVEKPGFVQSQASWSELEGNFTRLGEGNAISMRVLDQDGNILQRFGPGNVSGWGFFLSYSHGMNLYVRFENVIPIISGSQMNYTSNDVRAYINLTYSYQKNSFGLLIPPSLSGAADLGVNLVISTLMILEHSGRFEPN